jgi:predicted TIM-barrel fold metal-dependent hydrolase
MAEEYDQPYGIVMADPFHDDAADRLRAEAAHEDVVGYRLAPVYPRDRMYAVDPSETVRTDWLLDAIEETTFGEATAETGTAVTLLVQYEQLDQVLELVERDPELDYVVDHMARAYADVPFDDPEFATFEDLAEYDNVLVKASALGLLAHEAFPFADIEGARPVDARHVRTSTCRVGFRRPVREFRRGRLRRRAGVSRPFRQPLHRRSRDSLASTRPRFRPRTRRDC